MQAVFHSELCQQDKQELATSYMDYILENALSISQIKAVENKLTEVGLKVDLASEPNPSSSQQLPSNSVLGKRLRTD